MEKENVVTEAQSLPKLTKKIKVNRCWFESVSFWPKTLEVQITAEQKDLGRNFFMATGEITIEADGQVLLKDEMPWGMPIGEPMLLMQVYTLSQMPNYKHPEWQKAMEAFCFSFPDFSPPTKLWWSKPGDEEFLI